MIRVGLIAYLLVATLAGPAWCCCTFARAVSSAFQTASKKSSEAPTRSCCSSPVSQNTSDEGSKSKPSDQPDKCPCKEARDVQPVIFVAIDGADQSQKVLSFAFCDFDTSAFSHVLSQHASVLELNGRTHIPFSGRDILLAFQTFRC